MGLDPTSAFHITLQEVVITAATLKPSALQDPNSDLWGLIGGYNPLSGSMHPEIYSGYNYLSGERYDTFVARTSGTGVTGGYGGYNSSNPHIVDIASAAIANGLAFNEFYSTLDAARLGNVAVDAKSIIKNVLDSNLAQTIKNEVEAVAQLKGIAILSATGRVLGFTQAYSSLDTLYTDITDGDGQVSMVNIADATINCGSLFIKSNMVGAAVSLGWLLIKGEFEE